jgi:hypothetical protein
MFQLQDHQEITVPAELKASRHYIAEAVPNPSGDGYIAQWAAPGFVPRPVLDTSTHQPSVFDTEREAEAEARRVLFNSLNSASAPRSRAFVPNRPGPQQDVLFQKMAAGDFAAKLADADITIPELAFIWGTKPERVDNWIKGIDAVPFAMHWVLELLVADQNNFEEAMNAAAKHVEIKQRKPK